VSTPHADSPQVQLLTDEEIFAAHEGGKLSVQTTASLQTARALSIAYTPGVARVCTAIATDPELVHRSPGRLVSSRWSATEPPSWVSETSVRVRRCR